MEVVCNGLRYEVEIKNGLHYYKLVPNQRSLLPVKKVEPNTGRTEGNKQETKKALAQ